MNWISIHVAMVFGNNHKLIDKINIMPVKASGTVTRGGPTCVHESLQVQCIWPGRYHVTAMTSMHWTFSDSCTNVGPPLDCHMHDWMITQWSNMYTHMTRIDNTYTIQYLYRSVILQSQQSSSIKWGAWPEQCHPVSIVSRARRFPRWMEMFPLGKVGLARLLFQVHTATADLPGPYTFQALKAANKTGLQITKDSIID